MQMKTHVLIANFSLFKKNRNRVILEFFFFSASPKHKLVLFNLCNDVCQNGKRKKAGVYIESFKNVLAEALAHSR